MVIYSKSTGLVVCKLPAGQTIDSFFFHHPQEFKDDLVVFEGDATELDNPDIEYAKIEKNKAVELNDIEVKEIILYGEILSEDNRGEINLLDSIKPNYDELQKAKRTIEFIDLMSEVL